MKINKITKTLCLFALIFSLNINCNDKYLSRYLIKACSENNADLFKFLIFHNVSNYRQTPLHLAAARKSIDICKLLIESGTNVNAKGIKGATALHEICLKYLYNSRGDLVEYYSSDDRQEHEVYVRMCEIVKYLIEKGIDINSVNDQGNTALSCLLTEFSTKYAEPYKNEIDFIKLLIENQDTLEIPNCDGNTALHIACKHRFSDICEFLIENGANVNFVNKNGETPLHVSAKDGFGDICELLIESGANVNALDFNRNNPLHLACDCQETTYDLCELLIKSGANVNIKNNHGNIPLHLAAATGKTDVCKLLIKSNSGQKRQKPE